MFFDSEVTLWSSLGTILIMYGPHILLAAWALSRLAKSSLSDSARALWTALIVLFYAAGPLLYLHQYYRPLIVQRWQRK